jgi:hypothetical protein
MPRRPSPSGKGSESERACVPQYRGRVRGTHTIVEVVPPGPQNAYIHVIQAIWGVHGRPRVGGGLKRCCLAACLRRRVCGKAAYPQQLRSGGRWVCVARERCACKLESEPASNGWWSLQPSSQSDVPGQLGKLPAARRHRLRQQ